MKIVMMTIVATLLFACLSPVLAMGPVDASAQVGLFSKYIWRGIALTDDPVLQPSVSADILGFGAEIWGNMDLTDIHGTTENPDGQKNQLNEIDYTLYYGISLPLLQFKAGLIHYSFPKTDLSSTTEIFASAAANVLLSPRFSFFYDIDEIDGGYILMEAAHDVTLNPGSDLNLSASLGYGSADYVQGYFGELLATKALTTLGTGPTDLQITAALPYHPFPFITVTPAVTYSTLLGDAKDVTDAAGASKDAFFFGVTAGFSF